VVEEITDYVDEGNPGRARVLWRGDVRSERDRRRAQAFERIVDPSYNASENERAMAAKLLAEASSAPWVACLDLVLKRKAPAPKSDEQSALTITPNVVGINQFSVVLFGDNRTGWYRYESSKGAILVARGKAGSALIRKAGDEWEAWERDRDGDDVRLVARGPFADVQSRVTVKAQEWNKDWQRDPATPRQLETLAKFNLKRDRLSKGEASLLIELKIMGMLITNATKRAAA
jgi:hypothetical protein